MVYRDREWYEAGRFFENIGMFNHSIFHYLESGFPTHAARYIYELTFYCILHLTLVTFLHANLIFFVIFS